MRKSRQRHSIRSSDSSKKRSRLSPRRRLGIIEQLESRRLLAADSWMGDLATEHPFSVTQTLSEYVLPGSHDAGSYQMKLTAAGEDAKGSELVLDIVNGCRDFFGDLSILGVDLDSVCSSTEIIISSVIEPFAETQNHTILEQLENGSRNLDLRFFQANEDDEDRSLGQLVADEFYIHHLLAGPNADEIFRDLATFLDDPAHRQEIIILDFNQMAMSTEGMTEFLERLYNEPVGSGKIGDFMAPNIEVQEWVGTGASNGTSDLTIKLNEEDPVTATGIAYDADASTIQNAIDTALVDALEGYKEGDIKVLGGPLNSEPVTFTFGGSSVVGQDHGEIEAVPSADYDGITKVSTMVNPLGPQSTIQDFYDAGSQVIVTWDLSNNPDNNPAGLPSEIEHRLWKKFEKKSFSSNFTPNGSGYPTAEYWNTERKIFDMLADDLAARRPDDSEVYTMNVALGVDDSALMMVRGTICPNDPLNVTTLCPATNNDWDEFGSLKKVSSWTNPKLIPMLVGLPRDQVNSVIVDYYSSDITDEFIKLNQEKVARVQVSIDSVSELRSHDLSGQPDYYATIEFSPDDWPAAGGPHLEIRNDKTINPNWLGLRSMTADTDDVTATIEIYDADDIEGDDDKSKLDGDTKKVEITLPISSCLQDTSTCVDGSGSSKGSTPVIDLGILGEIPTGTDSSKVTYSYEVCEWSTCAPLTGDTGSPTADAGGPYVSDEGTPITLTGAASTDPNQSTESLTFEWDFDSDGEYDDATGMEVSFTGYDGPADLSVLLRVTDEDGNQSISDSIVSVANVAPSITSLSLSPPLVNEGDVVVLSGAFSDPALDVATETFELEIDWNGDMVYDQTIVVDGGTFAADHIYQDDDPSSGSGFDAFDINLRLRDDDGGEDTETTSITVKNVAPEITTLLLDSSIIDETESVVLSGTFDDAALGVSTEAFELDIDWNGDATFDETVVVENGTFEVGHTYLDDNPSGTSSDIYQIQIRLRDDDLGSGTADIPLRVNNVNPTITSFSSDATFDNLADEGEAVTISGTFTDIGVQDTFTAIVDWGDGSSPERVTVNSRPGSGVISGQHTYDAGGVYTVTVTLTDDDLGSHQASTIAVVTGVGVTDGTLFVIGTNEGEDSVAVQESRNGVINVKSSITAENSRSFDPRDGEINTLIVYLGDGDDRITVSGGIELPAIIHGGEGNDHLNAGGSPSVLDGGPGDDRLVGSTSFDILIGGTGQDRLIGGNGQDVLIGGSIDDDEEDGDDSLLLDALNSWTDEEQSFQDRANLIDALLTVFDDEEEDSLTGGSRSDVIYNGFFDTFSRQGNGDDVIKKGTESNQFVLGDAGDELGDGGTGFDVFDGGLGMNSFVAEEAQDVIFPYHNSLTAWDINADGQTSPIDALLVINWLARNGQSDMPEKEVKFTENYDVTRDDQITPLDALLVINHLARIQAADIPELEGVSSTPLSKDRDLLFASFVDREYGILF